MNGLDVLFVFVNYLSLVPIIVVLVIIGRQQRAYNRHLKVLERALQQPARPVKAAATLVAVPASRGEASAAPLPPWLRPNYMAPEVFVRAGFDYTIQPRTKTQPWPVRDQGGFATIQNRYHRRQGGVFTVTRTIYLN